MQHQHFMRVFAKRLQAGFAVLSVMFLLGGYSPASFAQSSSFEGGFVQVAAASKQKEKIQKSFTQLKKLLNPAAPANKVNSFVKKLSQLDPKKANKYYKTGLTKLTFDSSPKGGTGVALTKQIAKILKRSDLSEKQFQKIQKNIQKSGGAINSTTPTPAPYQA